MGPIPERNQTGLDHPVCTKYAFGSILWLFSFLSRAMSCSPPGTVFDDGAIIPPSHFSGVQHLLDNRRNVADMLQCIPPWLRTCGLEVTCTSPVPGFSFHPGQEGPNSLVARIWHAFRNDR